MTIDSGERNDFVMTLASEAQNMPPSERESFLQSACQNDPELYQAVSDVVAWEARMSGFLDHPLIEFIDLETLEEIFEPGETVSGRFEILRRVGEGGMGVVHEAFDRKRKQRIAIKFAKPGFGPLLSPELEGALQVRHPNICVVNEIHTAAVEFGDVDFLTMEFLDGETLANRLKKGKLDEPAALEIARQLCAGVAEAHRSGILHRDLKPGNVILCHKKDGSTRAVITDFGLSTDSTIAAEIAGGTPSYMAPELLHGGKTSQASDVFSLGVVLYEMVTGQKPFPATAESNGEAYSPAAPSKLARNVSRRWDAAILPCLRPKPEERCSATQVLATLERRPLYYRLAAAIAACLVVGVLVIPKIIPRIWPPPSPVRLAMLPIEDSSGLLRDQGMLNNVSNRLQQMQVGDPTVSVIPLSKMQSQAIKTPEEAKRIFGATHALELKLHPESSGVAIEGAVIDLNTMAHVRDYSAHFAEADLADLPAGLTGVVGWAFHIHRTSQREAVTPAAAEAYKNGREYLKRESRELSSFINAASEFEKAARLDPHSPLPLAGLAEAHARKYQIRRDEKTLQDAQFWLARAEALNADSPTVRMASGLLHLIEGDYPKALEDYKRVEEIESDNVEAWLGSGFAYESQGRLPEAMTDYNRAIAVEPDYYKPYEYLGGLLYYHGQYAEAEELFKKDIKLAPDRVNAYGSLAGVYTAQAKYEEAESVHRALLQLRESALTLNNIGAALAFQGRQKEAIEYYQRAVAMEPNRAMYWLNLGDAQRRVKDLVDARKSYQRGLQLTQSQVISSPASASARAYLAYFQARLGFENEARAQIAQALHSPSRDDQVVLCSVQTYEALGERKQALGAAAMATPQTRTQMAHHPDLAGLASDSRFTSLKGQIK